MLIIFIINKTNEAIAALAGMVIIHAYTMRFPTPHRTADSLLVAPTPMIEPAIAWVVLTGIPISAIDARIAPPPVSAQNPGTV